MMSWQIYGYVYCVCANEKAYLAFKVCNNSDLLRKSKLRDNFKNAQTNYDRKLRFYKRKFKKQESDQLSISSSDNPAEMWAKLKRLAEPVTSRVAMEIVREDGTISHDVKEVLQRWHKDISQLFSGIREDPDIVFED